MPEANKRMSPACNLSGTLCINLLEDSSYLAVCISNTQYLIGIFGSSQALFNFHVVLLLLSSLMGMHLHTHFYEYFISFNGSIPSYSTGELANVTLIFTRLAHPRFQL